MDLKKIFIFLTMVFLFTIQYGSPSTATNELEGVIIHDTVSIEGEIIIESFSTDPESIDFPGESVSQKSQEINYLNLIIGGILFLILIVIICLVFYFKKIYSKDDSLNQLPLQKNESEINPQSQNQSF
jgi:hypothetical protein